MRSERCPDCRQLVAADAMGRRPHDRHGKPCAGGRPAPKLPVAAERTPLTISVSLVAGRAKRAAGMAARKMKRDEAVRKLLPAASIDIARALGISTELARTFCLRLGAVLDDGSVLDRTRNWRLPQLAEAAK